MNFNDKNDEISAELEAIKGQQNTLHQQIDDAARQLTSAMAERDRLQNICTEFERLGEHEPPYVEFAQAVLAADRAAATLEAAERASHEADQKTHERLSILACETMEMMHQMARVMQAEMSTFMTDVKALQIEQNPLQG